MEANELLTVLSDRPTSIDRLGFQDYANTLANIIKDIQTPSTVGVFGDWGSGKTSLMMMVEEQLKQNSLKVIWFNAWKYSKEDALWRALILAILKGVGAKKTFVEDAVIKLYSAISSEKLGKVELDWLEIAKVLIKGIAIFTLPFLWIPGFAQLLGEWGIFDQITKAFTRKSIEQTQERISSIEEFEKLYREIISNSTKDGNRLVIFIDDLDRCLPEKALEVLEALKSFLDAEGCVYVVACDTRLIRQGLLEKYKEQSGIDLDDYLEKIIQFPFNIPPIRVEDAISFIEKMGWISDYPAVLRLITTTLERNPRKLKRFLSNLELKRQIAQARDLRIKMDVMVKMSCVANSWAFYWNRILDNPSIFVELQKYALDNELAQRISENPDVQLIFSKEPKLIDLLRQKPLISESDLNEYVFLAKTTVSSIETNTTDFQKIQNPYGVGTAKSGNFLFFRENELQRIQNYIDEHNSSLVLLRGQRGIGKTVLLQELWRRDTTNLVHVYVDMQGYFTHTDEVGVWLYELARKIEDELSKKGYSIKFRFSSRQVSMLDMEKFLDEIQQSIEGKKLVLLLDEYDALESLAKTGQTKKEIPAALRFLLGAKPFLSIVICGMYPDLTGSSSGSPLSNMVGLVISLDSLDVKSVEDLITKPAEGLLEYAPEAVRFIADQTGGHPLLISLFCSLIFEKLSSEKRDIVTLNDVKSIVNDATFRDYSSFFAWIAADDLQNLNSLVSVMREREVTMLDIQSIKEILEMFEPDFKTEEFLERMIRSQILKRVDNDNYVFGMQLFYDWLLRGIEKTVQSIA